MERVKVQSSALAEIGYDESIETLEVAFHPTKAGVVRVFQYSPVHRFIHEEMVAEGASIGTIFHRYVRSQSSVSAVEVTHEQAVSA